MTTDRGRGDHKGKEGDNRAVRKVTTEPGSDHRGGR